MGLQHQLFSLKSLEEIKCFSSNDHRLTTRLPETNPVWPSKLKFSFTGFSKATSVSKMQCGTDLRVGFIFMLWIIPSFSTVGGPEMLLANRTQHTGAGSHYHDQAPPSSMHQRPLIGFAEASYCLLKWPWGGPQCREHGQPLGVTTSVLQPWGT